MQEIWGRRIVWAAHTGRQTHPLPIPAPPWKLPPPPLGDGWPDCLLINWIVSLINGQDKDEAAKYATTQLYTHRRMWEYLIKSTRHLIMAFVMENWFKRMYCPFWLQLLQMYSEMKKSGLKEDGRRTNDLAGHPISRTKGRNWNINPSPLIPPHINALTWHSQ